MRYLKGTMHLGLLIQPSDSLTITAFSDVDWAANVDDRKSVATYYVFLGNSLISWASKKQVAIARSSTEFEYRALAHATTEITWIRNFLSEIGFPLSGIPVLWCDNLGAGAFAANPVFHARTKHIEIDVHYVRDQVLNGNLNVRYVPSKEQVADCLTKALSHDQFFYLRNKLDLVSLNPRLRGDIEEEDS